MKMQNQHMTFDYFRFTKEIKPAKEEKKKKTSCRTTDDIEKKSKKEVIDGHRATWA